MWAWRFAPCMNLGLERGRDPAMCACVACPSSVVAASFLIALFLFSPSLAGVCYQSPGLKAEDLEGEPAEAARALETAQAVERERDEATKRDRGEPAKAAKAEESEATAKADVAASSAFAAFDPEIGAAMARLGYSVPMPVQKEAWLPLCEGRDVVAVAAPGAGKTVAYLLPAAMRVAEARADQDAAAPRACPVALVLVPTRELAQQVARDARAALRAKVGLLHGGVDKDEQVRMNGRGGGGE